LQYIINSETESIYESFGDFENLNELSFGGNVHIFINNQTAQEHFVEIKKVNNLAITYNNKTRWKFTYTFQHEWHKKVIHVTTITKKKKKKKKIVNHYFKKKPLL